MIGTIGSRGFFLLRDHAPRVHLILVLLSQAGEIVDSGKEDCSPETCHDREEGKMAKQRNGMERQNPDGSSQPGKTAARAHTTRGQNSQLQGKWKEISAESDAVGTTVKEKTKTWNKSCKESVKKEKRNCTIQLRLQSWPKKKDKKKEE